MKFFNYNRVLENLLSNPDIVEIAMAIQEYKGKQELFIEAKSDILEKMLEVAIIQSTGASNRIEGIYTSEKRLEEIIVQKSEPKNRSEEEISGYRDVLTTIHENYDYITIKPSVLLQLHRDLYSFSLNTGGTWKNQDNEITEIDSFGNKSIRFKPLSVLETPLAMENLCNEYNRILKEKTPYLRLFLIPVFILDFLSIHPFNDGNGRMSRLLTLLLLYQNNYIVGKYISLEMLIEKTKSHYYDSLKESSFQWNDNLNSYSSFVKYSLQIILKAYREFSERVELLSNSNISKYQRIKNLFDNRLSKINKKNISITFPDISITTIERTLKTLLEEEYIEKIGSGRNTSYVRKNI